jgi:hypothetical protein
MQAQSLDTLIDQGVKRGTPILYAHARAASPVRRGIHRHGARRWRGRGRGNHHCQPRTASHPQMMSSSPHAADSARSLASMMSLPYARTRVRRQCIRAFSNEDVPPEETRNAGPNRTSLFSKSNTTEQGYIPRCGIHCHDVPKPTGQTNGNPNK